LGIDSACWNCGFGFDGLIERCIIQLLPLG
jgi:hypothetical protein